MKRNIVDQFYSVYPAFKTEWSRVQGCIVNKDWDHVEKTVSQKLAEGVSPTEIEQQINHCHMSMLLAALQCPNTASLRKKVAELFCAISSYRLKKQFVDEEFCFEMLEDASEVTVFYYAKR